MKNIALRMTRIFLWSLLPFSALLFLNGCASQEDNPNNTELPNIVLIMADDMGYGDASCYNDSSLIPTPNIDRLASEGILFTDAHAPAALCTPSRYGLLTGRYSWRTRLKKGVILGYDEAPLIEEGRNTLGSLLQQAGYNTACIGKWHLGLNWETKDDYVIREDNNDWNSEIFKENEKHIDFSKPVSGGPQDLGFDYSFITLGCSTSDPPYVFIENSYPVSVPEQMSPEEYSGLPGFVPGLMDTAWSQELVDTIFTHKGIKFIEDHLREDPDKPFFLYLALSSPHIPFMVPDFAKGKTEEGPRGDLVYLADYCLGNINKIIEDHGLTENTLVIFTSDNGPRRGANGHKSAGELKGYKASIWEGGHRVPFIARWPEKIEAGIRSDALISLTDMYATFANITGMEENEGGEDSYDITERLTGQILDEDDDNPRIFHSGQGIFAFRKNNWKYIEGELDENGRISKIHPDSSGNTGMLYDLSEDLRENHNVADENPAKAKELYEILDAQRR